ncbi:hypothetical protein A6R68_23549 [Neotoma lepida]|uniref:Uncharacterized protein n=1 Tax=Neotoma lepida TaxID=56216 RepID=A0A1A6HVI0_NEOLE|nr:hypothetical protein A6R68_23549 [Neotoma lepida]
MNFWQLENCVNLKRFVRMIRVHPLIS